MKHLKSYLTTNNNNSKRIKSPWHFWKSLDKTLLVILALIALFMATRITALTRVPSSLYWDEASIGYNAYSIALNGKDEWGSSWPLNFRAFGEFKLPVYIYAVALVTKMLGPSMLAVRLPAVLFSLGAVIVLFFLVKKLSGDWRLGALASLYLAISHWFFVFSRTGYEATAGVFFGLLWLYLAISKKPLLSVLAAVLAVYSYNSFRIILPPLILLQMIYMVYKNKQKVRYIGILAVFTALLVPVAKFYLVEGSVRLNSVSAGSFGEIIKNYLGHFSLDFLLSGDKNFRSTLPGFGVVYTPDILVIVMGLYYLFRKKIITFWLITALILLSLIPSAITKEAPHALRAIFAVPFVAVLWSYGIIYLSQKVSKSRYVIIGTCVVAGAFFVSYFGRFLFTYNSLASSEWQLGYKKIYDIYSGDFGRYSRVVISDAYTQPYIFALYYQKVSPEEFRGSVTYNTPDRWGVSLVRGFGKFEFKKPVAEDVVPGSLVFAAPLDGVLIAPNNVILNADGSVAFYVYEDQNFFAKK